MSVAWLVIKCICQLAILPLVLFAQWLALVTGRIEMFDEIQDWWLHL